MGSNISYSIHNIGDKSDIMRRGRETWAIQHRILIHFLYPFVWIGTILILLSWGVLGSFDIRLFIILLLAGFVAGLVSIIATYYLINKRGRRR